MQRQFSAGGVVFRKSQIPNSKSQIMWLVTKSTSSKEFPRGFWRLPKGWIDESKDGKIPGPVSSGKKKASEEEIRNAALREVRGEGGIEARIVDKIGTERYFFY
ncbi:MAG: hypothetical protein US53_C0022G0007 [Candidatus Woesebacteria bacterium GW2011_GWA1_37_7]|uniref:Uncharacterized protein n=1 Tax=Candidatus Woesebacteria bacterium GW2011_GWA1_37_7 TaxID=1618545 RepID=A0A0G0H573_9BACT|nr:MAG: hypothetical protein US53_C0022G0007 [Candidatus Woesebacteria bacterium GW2011_GWA1_37_7]